MECIFEHQAEDPIEGTAKDFYELKKLQEDDDFDGDISNAHEDVGLLCSLGCNEH